MILPWSDAGCQAPVDDACADRDGCSIAAVTVAGEPGAAEASEPFVEAAVERSRLLRERFARRRRREALFGRASRIVRLVSPSLSRTMQRVRRVVNPPAILLTAAAVECTRFVPVPSWLTVGPRVDGVLAGWQRFAASRLTDLVPVDWLGVWFDDLRQARAETFVGAVPIAFLLAIMVMRRNPRLRTVGLVAVVATMVVYVEHLLADRFDGLATAAGRLGLLGLLVATLLTQAAVRLLAGPRSD
ncbi:hypothetical protein ACFFX1_16445 [Dactylosporangium sucinum]|uniref:Uncharacterized protein n=1 Tax=Dactylosporangium sucinum TaxID=1424081 RepID=A0A917TLE1_9ACTN|nr:hypothetical protein [Dactylosporangium sucinum]GGM26715.1 hypothetical protein GCM10007977_029800 [Dactylosporangium sucinum]